MIVDSAHFLLGARQPGPLTVPEAAARPRRGGSFVWLELYEPGTEEMGELRAHFGLHELAVEDAARAHQRPKVEGYDDFYFIVFRTARNDARRERVEFGEVHVFLGLGYVIAVRHGDTGDLTGARQRLEQRPALLRSGPAAVVWGILDAVVDDYEPVVEELENDIETLEHDDLQRAADATERIYELKQEVNHPLSRRAPAAGPARSDRGRRLQGRRTPRCCATSATSQITCGASTRRCSRDASSSTACSRPTRR